MINEANLPIRLQKEEALLQRLPKSHPKYEKIRKSIAKRRAGHQGELNVDYHLSYLPTNKFTILPDLHLKNANKKFQIDRLLLSPNLILNIEIKNLAGTLFFDRDSKQLIQTYNNKEKGYPNPMEQAKRQLFNLTNWLQKHKLTHPPLDYFVTISFPSTILRSNDRSFFQKVFHAEHLVKKIKEIEQLHPNPIIDDKILRKMKRTFLKENSPSNSSILDVWEIDVKDILLGVQCPRCSRLPMSRQYGVWFCSSCNSTSKDAHIQAIHDYFLLMKSSITNKECREFLSIPSRRVAENILKGSGLIPIGNTKNTYYKKP